MKPHSAIKTDLLADEHHRKKIDTPGDRRTEIAAYMDYAARTAERGSSGPRSFSPQGGFPPYPTETWVFILVLNRLHNLSEEQMEYQLLDRMSYQRFCGVSFASDIPDCAAAVLENQIDEAVTDATLGPAPKQHKSRGEKELLKEGMMSALWYPGKRRQKDPNAAWTKKHGKSHFRCKLTISLDKKHKFVGRLETNTASTQDSQHFENVFAATNMSRDVYLGCGYPSQDRKAWPKVLDFRYQIQQNSKRNQSQSECQQRCKKRLSKTRACVEHIFAVIPPRRGKLIRTIGERRASFAMTRIAPSNNLKRLVYLLVVGVEAS